MVMTSASALVPMVTVSQPALLQMPTLAAGLVMLLSPTEFAAVNLAMVSMVPGPMAPPMATGP